LKFAREISADPGEGAEDWELAVIPRARHIGKDGQD
jgi:hypothetical protein